MNNFINKVKDLSQKAAEIKAAMQQVPPKVAEIREAVAATTGQLQQLKSEIHFTVADLKAEDEDRLSSALQEINASVDVFAKAGFLLSGVDLEISPVQRLLVRLAKVEDVHASLLRSLLSANKHRRTTHAILSAMLQAGQMAETVDLSNLDYNELIVSVGPVPSVRLCWRMEEIAEPAVAPSQSSVPVPAPIAASAPTPQPVFGPGSFFEQRPGAAAAKPQPLALPVAGVKLPVPAEESAGEPAGEVSATNPVVPAEKQDPLARFKKMPDFSKRQ